MSKAIYICYRNKTFTEGIEKRLFEICNQITPDNVNVKRKSKIHIKDDIAYAITRPNGVIYESGSSVILGFLYEQTDSWVFACVLVSNFIRNNVRGWR